MIVSLKGEIWKPFRRDTWRENENFKVSNFGRVIRFKYKAEGELLNNYQLGGYPAFYALKKAGKSDLIYVHRAVAELFLDPPQQGQKYVLHKDFNKANNHVDNLMHASQKELTQHNLKNPSVIKAKKESLKNPRYSKLTAGRVRLIKRKIFDPNRKTRMRIIAKQFGISEMQLYRIKSGENWGHITDY